MATTAEYLNKLVEQKNTLADNLATKGVSASHDETLETLVPKVLDISSGGGGNGIYPIDEYGFPTGDIVIPVGVTSLGVAGYKLFNRPATITSISCPNTLTAIANNACYGASNMTSITGIDGVTSIGDSAFYGCYKLNVDLPISLKTIGGNAFFQCTGIKSITIPALTSWGSGSFSKCDNLQTVCFGDDFALNNIPISSFNYCTALKSFNFPSSVTKISNSAFAYSGIESIVIPDTVTYIDSAVFSDCTSLTEVTLPNTITYINATNGSNNNTFNRCTAISTVNLAQDFNCTISFCNSTAITNAAEMLTKLKDLTGETAKTITFAKAVYDGLTAEEIAVATNKNWTVASYGS